MTISRRTNRRTRRYSVRSIVPNDRRTGNTPIPANLAGLVRNVNRMDPA